MSTCTRARPLRTSSYAPRKSSRVPIVEPKTVSCFHQNRCSAAGGFGPLVAPQTATRPAGATAASDRAQVASPTVSTTTSTPAAGRLLHGLDDVAGVVVDRDIRAPGACLLELLVAARGDDRPRAERAADLERCGRDSAADAPDQNPLVRLHGRLRDEHPVGRLVDERKRRRLLERQRVVERGTPAPRRPRSARSACRRECSPMTEIMAPCSMPGLSTTRSPTAKPSTPAPSASTTPAPSAPRIRGFGTEGRPMRTHTSRWLSDAAARRTSTCPVGRLGIGDVLVPQDLGPAVLVDPDRLHGHNPRMTAAELARCADELGLDVVGAAPAEAYDETEQHIRDAARAWSLRRHEVHDGAARGLVPPRAAARRRGAHRRVGGPLLLGRRAGARPRRGTAAALRLARPLRAPARAARRARSAARRPLPRARRREPARRPRGRAARGRRLLRQEHDADHARARLVGRARHARHRRRDRGDAAARSRLRPLPPLHRRLPDRCARRARRARRESLPLVLDAGPGPGAGGVPRGARGIGLRLRHLPGRLSVEPWHREAPRRRAAPGRTRPRTSRSSTG